MIRTLMMKLLARFERLLGVELPYLRVVIEYSPSALVPIALSMPPSAYGRRVPASVLHMVRLGATQAQDCGECLQIAVNMARRDAVDAEDIRAALAGRLGALPPEMAEAFEFGRLAGGQPVSTDCREALRARYAEKGLIEASIAAASAQFFPVLKRGMGFAHACQLDRLEYGGDSLEAA